MWRYKAFRSVTFVPEPTRSIGLSRNDWSPRKSEKRITDSVPRTIGWVFDPLCKWWDNNNCPQLNSNVRVGRSVCACACVCVCDCIRVNKLPILPIIYVRFACAPNDKYSAWPQRPRWIDYSLQYKIRSVEDINRLFSKTVMKPSVMGGPSNDPTHALYVDYWTVRWTKVGRRVYKETVILVGHLMEFQFLSYCLVYNHSNNRLFFRSGR